METIGKTLQEARKSANKSLDEIHEQTRIAVKHLQFLEADNFSFLPATYVKSFLGSYAEAVNLDGEDLITRFNDLLAQEKHAQQEVREEHREKQVAGTKSRYLEWALGLGSFALLLCLVLVYVQYRSHIHAELAPALSKQVSAAQSHLAQVTVEQASSEVDTGASPLKLRVTARKPIWIRVTIDEEETLEYNLAPDKNLVRQAATRFDIVIGELDKMQPSNRPASVIEPRQNETLQLTFVKNRKPEDGD